MAETNIHQEIVNKTSGFSFRLVVEVEQRIETGAKYPDKVVKKAELGGHADTFDEACANLTNAKYEIREVLSDEPKEEEEGEEEEE